MKDRSHLLTEQRLPESARLDELSAAEIVALMNQQDRRAVDAVAAAQAEITRAIEIITEKFRASGRLIYIGAGTSGRLGVLDASECPPTFHTDPAMVVGVIAGGDSAMFRAKEGAEDDAADGAHQMIERNVGGNDVVCGIAAGGTTPFVHGALAEARRRSAATLFITCVDRFEGEPAYDVTIRALTGPEVLTGSTRLKAGTATKLILNQLTTASMVRLGKCYGNQMVDLRASNVKLRDRAARIVAQICEIDRDTAIDLLAQSGGEVKTAIVMHRGQLPADAARERLQIAEGRLRSALA